MNIDKIVEEIKNLKSGQDDEYYNNLYIKIRDILNGNYTEKEKTKIMNTGRVSTIYMLSSYSDK